MTIYAITQRLHFFTLPVGTLDIFVIFVCVDCGEFTKQRARNDNYINFIISAHLNLGWVRNLMKRKFLKKFM